MKFTGGLQNLVVFLEKFQCSRKSRVVLATSSYTMENCRLFPEARDIQLLMDGIGNMQNSIQRLWLFITTQVKQSSNSSALFCPKHAAFVM